METKGFFLGLIAAVVLFLLWRKEHQGITIAATPRTPQPQPSTCGVGGCGCNGPSCAVSPEVQNALAEMSGGQITPGTPPLNSAVGPTSFYANSGPTPDSTFTFATETAAQAPGVPGSPTTPAAVIPIRATEPVPVYAEQGFTSQYSRSGVSRSAAREIVA